MSRLVIFSALLISLFLVQTAPAAAGEVTLLESSITGKETAKDINEYIKGAFKPFLGLVAALAVVMIVWGGLEYIFSQVPGIKTEAKQRIWAAIFGLILTLGAYLLLETINPQIVETEFIVNSPSNTPQGGAPPTAPESEEIWGVEG